MARRPTSDERSVLGPPPKFRKGERFWLGDLAAFLRATRGDVAKFLRRQGLLRRTYPAQGRPARGWTTARGVELAIVHFRARLGAKYLAGKDPLRSQDLSREAARRRTERAKRDSP